VTTSQTSSTVLQNLLDPARLAGQTSDEHGFLDLVTDDGIERMTIAQRAMENPALARIYEKVWRPAFTRAFSFGGTATRSHTNEAIDKLRSRNAGHFLDVACGPGLHTRKLGDGADGFVVGLDLSIPMLREAVRSTSNEHVAYLRADAHHLPFADGTFDAACCLAALYLIPEPHQVIDEMIRVLKPGGILAIFTTADVKLTRLPMVKPTLSRVAGLNVLGRDEIPSKLHRRGFTEISQRIAGQGQFITARK
jgi:ubiquinone/menaquinone biosynthesis C-methylase UbiE